VTCGATECSVATDLCCRSLTGDAGCVAKNGDCQGAEITCDEAADCDQGKKCCLGFSIGSGGGGAKCSTKCDAIQLCTTNAECGDAGACALRTCGSGQFSQTIRMCGTRPGCN